MLQALESRRPEQKPTRFQEFLMPSGECVVKGITFFGTPFKGSLVANWVEPLVRHLPVPLNLSFVERLKEMRENAKAAVNLVDEDVSKIVDDFEALATRLNIPLLIFWEERPVRRMGFKVHVSLFERSWPGNSLNDR